VSDFPTLAEATQAHVVLLDDSLLPVRTDLPEGSL